MGLFAFSCRQGDDAKTSAQTDQGSPNLADSAMLVRDARILDLGEMVQQDLGESNTSPLDMTAPTIGDMERADIGLTCTPEDCGLRVPELVDECSGGSGEFLLNGCEPDADGRCRWVFSECPEDPPCVGTTCDEPCDPWTYFDAGDGCNQCQCGPSMRRADAHCTVFNCAEVGCRNNQDCDENEYCNFPTDRCGIDGRRGQCEPLSDTCEAAPIYTCGCNGAYGANRCALLGDAGVDEFPFGGCLIPDLGEAVACGPSVCLGQEFYCRIDIDNTTATPQFSQTCEVIPEGCVQGDCSCLVDKLSTHDCFNGGGYVVMVERVSDRSN